MKNYRFIVFIMIILFFSTPFCSIAAELSIMPNKTSIACGEAFSLDINVDNADDLAGCTFTLSYPDNLVILDNPEVKSNFFQKFYDKRTDADLKEIIPFEKNTDTPGQIALSGVYINTDEQVGGGGNYKGKQTLFTIYFKAKENAISGNLQFELQQTMLRNVSAGDLYEGAPILIKAFPKGSEQWNTEKLSDDFEVMLSLFKENPKANIAIITNNSNKDTDKDGMPDEWEIKHGLNPLIDDSKDDKDNDGFTNIEEYKNGTLPEIADYSPLNHVPAVPSINYPKQNSETLSLSPILSINNSNDLDKQKITYTFELYKDDKLTQLITAVSGIASGENVTEWQINTKLDDNKYYYWRTKAFDGIAYSDWSGAAKFFVNTANDQPSTPILDSPKDKSPITELKPKFILKNSQDADLDPLTYAIEIYADEKMTNLIYTKTGIYEGENGYTSWTSDIELKDNKSYWWRARAIDSKNLAGEWTLLSQLNVNTAANMPSVPIIHSPKNNEEVTTLEPVLEVENSIYPSSDELVYYFEIDTVPSFTSKELQKSSDIKEGTSNITSWKPMTLKDNTKYYWRAISYNKQSYSLDWLKGSFFVNLSNDAPLSPTLKNPGNNSQISTLNPILYLNESSDIDLDSLSYEIEVYSDVNLSQLVVSQKNNGVKFSISLPGSGKYYWRARAIDEHGAASSWSLVSIFTVDAYNQPPVPTLNNPVSGGFVTTLSPALSVNNVKNFEEEGLKYEFELYSDKKLSQLLDSAQVLQGNTITSWTVSITLTDNKVYYFRARVKNSTQASGWMSTAMFKVNTSGEKTIWDIVTSKEVQIDSKIAEIIQVVKDSLIKKAAIEIPPNALTEKCTLTIGIVTNEPSLPDNVKAVGKIIEFGPSGIQFKTPVYIKLPYSESDLSNGINLEQIEIYTYNTTTLEWEKVEIDHIDKENSLVVCKVNHFSMYTLGSSVTSSELYTTNLNSEAANSNTGNSGGSGCFITSLTQNSITFYNFLLICSVFVKTLLAGLISYKEIIKKLNFKNGII